ncbi:hypothetical protein HOY82DRAFT_600085 [Tuber indicum]|nr:hypothetical protein HOY82DRAFT_600085 [Tuber indicum]
MPSQAETVLELDKIRNEANGLELDNASHTLLNKALDMCSKVNTQSILDAATITRLQAVKPSSTDYYLIKGGLIFHTSVLSKLYKKHESNDIHKKALDAKKRKKARTQPRAAENLEMTDQEEDEMDCNESTELEENAISNNMGPYTIHPQHSLCKKKLTMKSF